ncbi:MAG: hypothetical protein AAGI30_12755 [Planctomycetota bacterium]
MIEITHRLPHGDSPEGAIKLLGPDDVAWGVWDSSANLATDSLVAMDGAPRLIVWSGWLGDEPFERHPGTWMPSGLEALNGAVDAWLASPASEATRLVLRPHARHVLCDPQRCFSFLRARTDQPIGLALDPDALLEDSMHGTRDEHLDRTFEALGPMCDAVWVGDRSGDDEIRARITRWCAADVAVIVAPVRSGA